MLYVQRNCIAEFAVESGAPYRDPFNDVVLDVVFTAPDGSRRRVPAFWSGGNVWRVRYASDQTGVHTYRTECSDEQNAGLHGRTGELTVVPEQDDLPILLRRGGLRVGENRRRLEYADGTPFFWLADTWWMGLCRRLRWPDEFQELAADRVHKGFTVIQIVAGLYPDMPPFDERGANEAGFPWESEYRRIRPDYFDMADLRIRYLVRLGLTPCIVGAWGYHLKWLGVERMKRHWRYLVARWGAYPVVWCLAGEGPMPYYLSETRDADSRFQKEGWTEIARYVRSLDPWRRPVTIHPSTSARESVTDPSVLDFDMLQTGHGDRTSLPNTVRSVSRAYAAEPRMPVINGEVCYEGIGGQCRQEVQRLMFWACMLSGACGHTYGANGIWQFNRRGAPFGPSPHGRAWGNTPWDEAMHLPGSAQVGLGKRLLERYEWRRFEPHPEWVEPHWTPGDPMQPYAAGIPGRVRVIYWPCMWSTPVIKDIESGAHYRAYLFDPCSGDEIDLGEVGPNNDGSWQPLDGRPPIWQDWVMVLETPEARRQSGD